MLKASNMFWVLVLTSTACIVLQMGSLVQKCRCSFKMMDLWPFSWSLLQALQTLNRYPALIRSEKHASTLSSTEAVSSVVLITAWIVSGLYKAVYLASFFHASAVQTREATAAERKNTVQRPLRVQQREGSPALESGPQHQQRSRGRRVLWTRTIEYLTVHLQPQSTLRHLYKLLFIIIELNQAPGRLTPNITTVCSLYLFVLFFRIL